MEDRVRQFFGESGPLAEQLDGYECRPSQIDMAALVATTLDDSSRAVIEAATGTGKTLAYLVPAALSDKKVLVSTATKNLQEQIYNKDVPFLRSLGLDLDVAYLKGRSNYLCKFRFEDFKRSPAFRSRDDQKAFSSILTWAETTQTGDRAELTDLPDDYATWMDLSISSDACLGTKCDFYEDCFITRVRRRAAQAQVVIVNHHLFFADLAVRADGHGEVLPTVDAVVFDEAHHLEQSASSFFGRALSIWRFRDLASDIQRALRELKIVPGRVVDCLDDVDGEARSLFRALDTALTRGSRVELSDAVRQAPEVQTAAESLAQALEDLSDAVGVLTDLGDTALGLRGRCAELLMDLRFLLGDPDSTWVYLIERRGKSDTPFLEARPIDLSDTFRELLYPTHETTIFTSATLTVDGRFDFFRSQIALGVDLDVTELLLPPAFDYMHQSLLYVPTDLPEPRDPDFAVRITPLVERLIELTRGRAFVLFTSYRNLHTVRDELGDRLPYPLLVQGERSRNGLLEAFRTEPSVLLGTSSFWEGVDVQGAMLSLVIIDKLPFASPADPMVRARINWVKEQGGDPFRHLQLPQAAITLKQGFGRLIRHREDRGIVAILDRRLLERSYGRLFLSTLPRARRTRDLGVVERWWQAQTQIGIDRPAGRD